MLKTQLENVPNHKTPKRPVQKKQATYNVLTAATFDPIDECDDIRPTIRKTCPGEKRRRFAKNLQPLLITSADQSDLRETSGGDSSSEFIP
jgi:hypothetical protein